jgi:hypothetical protein
MLARKEMYGATIPTVRGVYYLHKQAAAGYGVPAITLLYSVAEPTITFHSLRVG